jgi:Fe-Mn family superoxide dismutase
MLSEKTLSLLKAHQSTYTPLFLASLASSPVPIPHRLSSQLESSFGSLDLFKQEFINNASSNLAGFTLLVQHANSLKVINTYGTGTTKPSVHPLLALSTFEHAFVNDFKSKEKYIQAFLENVDWNRVGNRMRSNVDLMGVFRRKEGLRLY